MIRLEGLIVFNEIGQVLQRVEDLLLTLRLERAQLYFDTKYLAQQHFILAEWIKDKKFTVHL